MNRQQYLYSSFALLAVAAFGVLMRNNFSVSPDELNILTANKHKGVCWVGTPRPVGQTEFESLKKCGANWISQTPFGWQQNPGSPSLTFEPNSQKGWWGESEEGITVTSKLASANGFKVMLKPHLWIRESWPGDIAMKSSQDWVSWFDQYERFILYYAALAERTHAEILCIGTELHKTVAHEKEWRKLISDIRQIYKGKLVYAANFNEEFEDVKFWDDLDYIGIQAYFPLSQKERPAVDDLVHAWKKHLSRIEKIQRVYNKPVLFTELGYKSTADSAIEPWRWPVREDVDKVSHETQANCYEAFFRAAWNKKWLEGVYFWKWYPHGSSRNATVDFTPQGKPAEAVLARWFKQQ